MENLEKKTRHGDTPLTHANVKLDITADTAGIPKRMEVIDRDTFERQLSQLMRILRNKDRPHLVFLVQKIIFDNIQLSKTVDRLTAELEIERELNDKKDDPYQDLEKQEVESDLTKQEQGT